MLNPDEECWVDVELIVYFLQHQRWVTLTHTQKLF